MNKNVLVVDDDLDIREVLTYALESEGYTVHTAEEGEAALRFLHEHLGSLPGLIILDHMMPGMDGKAFLQAIQKEKNAQILAIPIFLSTAGNASFEDLPITGTLKKPMDLFRLFEVVKKYCG